MSQLLLLSTADTERLAARRADPRWRTANPARLPGERLDEALSELLIGVDAVVLRLLGGRRAWPAGVEALRAAGIPLLALGGEAAPDAELMSLSTVSSGVATQALDYLREGGVDNLRQLTAFLFDTLLLTGEAFDPPVPMPSFGVRPRSVSPSPEGGATHTPTVGIVYYRAHELSGNTDFVDVLADAVETAGGVARPVFCASLRDPDPALLNLLSGVDVVLATVLAAGGTVPADASAGGSDEGWDAGALAALNVPVLQAICVTTSREHWAASDAALTPMDAAMQVAIPEFDGRLIGVPFSFKESQPSAEPDSEPVPVYVADPERASRLARTALRLARLRHTPNAEKRIALVLSSYPTKHARIGNAVGLDTPASAVVLLRALRDAGYLLGDLDVDALDGDTLVHRLIAAGGHDVEWLTPEQLAAAPARVPLPLYRSWFDTLEPALAARIRKQWGEPPGGLYTDGDEIVLAALTFGNVVLMIQPPRGFGENPVAIYHDPALPPSHHYLAAYRWLAEPVAGGGFGVDAVIHLGKHGTLEWLPGKGLGLSASCAPDAVLQDLPLIYPFIVNDPGEGTQAKRRGHATVVDHLVPPMARADSYGDLARLEHLLDEYATVTALDPDKLPALRGQIWTLIRAAELQHDLHVDEMPRGAEFDEFVLHLDGYLCEVKDVQIRDGLHVLGQAPEGSALDNLAACILRASQIWAGRTGALPGLRAAVAAHYGLDEQRLLADPGVLIQVPERLRKRWLRAQDEQVRASAVLDVLDQASVEVVGYLREVGTDAGQLVLGAADPDVTAVLGFARDELLPRLARTTDEIANVLHALDGGFVPAGPSGSPTRGLVNVLPTGRNFYSVDPKAIPSRTAWDTGVALAESLLRRHQDETGGYPRSVGLTVWGTSAMRTQGDDIAELLWLLGCRPTWDDASRRVTGFHVVSLQELDRPRIDVTIRISGFFRDAFPHVITLLDDAVRAVADLDEPAELNYLREHVEQDLAGHGDLRRATTRIFGSKPGAYGAGLLPLVDAGNWRTDTDLAEVYAVWGGYAYGRELDGRAARDDLEAAFSRIQVAAKNQDNREHDLVDSDDYFQYHGGMVAMVRHLTGSNPHAYVGDSADPVRVRTRTLQEETHRVFRARVINPRWMAAMRRHGYKGAFEMAATVDYLFGYDATAGVVQDWMYAGLAEQYVLDPENRAFFERSNPWALRGIAERLLEAADRNLWEHPDQALLDQLRRTFLELEGDLEG